MFGLIGTNTIIQNTTIANSLYEFTNNTISLAGFVGGHEGYKETNSYTNNSKIIRCNTINTVIKGCYVSGIATDISNYSDNLIIDRCLNGADLYGDFASGICRSDCRTIISNCTNVGNITSDIGYAAGISLEPAAVVNSCNRGKISGKYAAGMASYIAYGGTNNISNCVNYGSIEGEHVAAILINMKRYNSQNFTIKNCVYEESYPIYYGGKNNPTFIDLDNCKCSKQEICSQATLNKLNSNLQSDWCRWVKGKDGYPVLDYYAEISGIENIRTDNERVSTIDVFNLQGISVLHNVTSREIDMLAPGIYILRQGKTIKKIVVR